MSTLARILPRERLTLVGDSLLLAAAFGGATLALVTLASELVTDTGWYEPASIAVMVVAVLLCPLVAWRLHGRRATLRTAVGATIGVVLSWLAVMAVVWLVAGTALVVNRATGDTVPMEVVALVVAASALVALVAWLDTDAVRDLVRAKRHVGLDVGRVVATAVVALTVVGTLWWAATHPDEMPGELLEFSLAFGVAAATVALGADVAARFADPARTGLPPTT